LCCEHTPTRFACQAELLLKRYTATADALRFRMETGSATVGNCVALLETKQ
jgi:hypothetical protein